MLTSWCVVPPQAVMVSDSALLRSLRAVGGLLLLTALLLLQLAAPPAQAQTLSLTFDDGFDAADAQAADDNAAMLAALKRHGIRAMLFPTGAAAAHPQNMALIRDWALAGHAIGNHTYSHAALSQTDTTQYFNDVLHAQALLRDLPGWCPRLRFPFLDEGGSGPQYHQIMQALSQADYGIAPATIALPDWDLTRRYEDILANGNAADALAFRHDYLEQVWKQTQAQETHWHTTLGRSPTHVLLLHTNRLNAAVLPDLLQRLQHQGWSFVDAAVAFQDPIYQRRYSQADGTVATLPSPACR